MANHGFNIALATKISMEAAVLFDNFYFWCSKNRANKCEDKFHNGLYWTYNTIKSYEKQFPYLNGKKIIAAIEKLEEAGLIVSGCFNANKYDRTKWYAVTELGNNFYEDRITIDQIDFEKKARTRSENKKANPNDEDGNSNCLFGQMNITDTDTDTNSYTNNSESVANAPSSEFANSETAEISEDSNTSPSLNFSEESLTPNNVTTSDSTPSSIPETKEHVPARGEAEMWASLPDLPEEPKPQPKAEKKPRTYYKAPTLTEIKEYIKTNNLTHVVAESFYHKYQSQNWCVGRTKINWQDKLKEWELTNANSRFGNRKQPASPYNLDIKNQIFDEGDWK